ncbi:MAG: fibronectin type III domain-containing protein [Halobacteriales archaeon]|nr:fibronectin type III domain-containing protein [Halobacteriales archaeon]
MVRALFVLLALLLPIVAVPLAGSATAAPPQGLHLAWPGDPRSSVSVTWHIASPDAGEGVEFGATSAYGARVAAHGAATGTSTTYTASLTGLAANTTYHYRVGSAASGWSADHTFRTAPASRLAREVRLGVIGDVGVGSVQAQLMGRLAGAGLDAVLHVGDVSYADGASGTWDAYFQQAEPALASTAYLPALGNHDVESCCAMQSFLARNALPGNERWWSADVGNVHVVALDDEPASGDGAHFVEGTNVFTGSDAQTAWLKGDLAAAKGSGRFIVVEFHRPLYSSSQAHPGNPAMRSALEGIFVQNGVDLVLNGHAHGYERTYPVAYGSVKSTSGGVYAKGSAPIYVVTGGGGESLYTTWQAQPAWSKVRAAAYEWVRLVAGPDGSLRVTALRTADNTVLDDFTIRPAAPPAATACSSPCWKEAESVAVHDNGMRVADGAASGGAGWMLWGNGELRDTWHVAAAGRHNVSIRAHGNQALGNWSQLALKVDGQVVKTWTLGSTSWWTATYPWQPAAGDHTLAAAFVNDANGGGQDRNLWVDKIGVS